MFRNPTSRLQWCTGSPKYRCRITNEARDTFFQGISDWKDSDCRAYSPRILLGLDQGWYVKAAHIYCYLGVLEEVPRDWCSIVEQPTNRRLFFFLDHLKNLHAILPRFSTSLIMQGTCGQGNFSQQFNESKKPQLILYLCPFPQLISFSG